MLQVKLIQYKSDKTGEVRELKSRFYALPVSLHTDVCSRPVRAPLTSTIASVLPY